MTTPTITQSSGAQHTRIYSYGAARGDLVVPNDDLIGPIDSSDEWIRQRTGIITRTRGSRNVGATELAVTASLEAIEKSGIDRADIDLVIVGTVSNTRVTPSISAVISDLVGVNPAAAYDSNAACAGFAYAVAQADAPVRVGESQ